METLYQSENIGAVEQVPRKTSLQRNRSNSPSQTLHEHYKLMVAIPLADSRINQLKVREDFVAFFCALYHQCCLVRVVVCNSLKQLDELFYWEQDLSCPKWLGSELRRWQSLWQQKSKEEVIVPHNLLLARGSCDVDCFQASIVSW